MPCSLGNPCGGQARLMVVLPDAHLYQCINGHTLRQGAAPPKLRNAPAVPYKLIRKRTYCRWRKCSAYSTRSSPYCYSHRPK